MPQKSKKLAFKNSGIQTYQIFRNDDEVCIPSFSSIFLAVIVIRIWTFVGGFQTIVKSRTDPT